MKNLTPTNVTDIPRYKASMPMQVLFVTNADKCGDHLFEQIARKGNIAVYKREVVANGRIAGYEVIKIKVVKAGTIYAKGAAPTTQDTESYPGAESFGFNAWSFNSPVSAMNKFNALVKEAATVVPPAPKFVIPAGQFTVIDFAKVNGLAVNVETAGRIGELLRGRAVKFLGVNERKIQLFAKA
jgi:hypothetical protein